MMLHSVPGPDLDLLSRLTGLAERDPSFVEQPLADAPDAIRRRLDLVVPAGLHVAEAAGGLLSVSLGDAAVTLPDPRGGELADNALDAVAGGGSGGGGKRPRRGA